jgi:hypothetical protein
MPLEKKALKLWKLAQHPQNNNKKKKKIPRRARKTYQSLVYVGFITHFMLNCLLFYFVCYCLVFSLTAIEAFFERSKNDQKQEQILFQI